MTNNNKKPTPATPVVTHSYPLTHYQNQLKDIDNLLGDKPKAYGSTLILGLMEEVGEIARAYLAEQGYKATNIKAQQDETYTQELGDLLVSILRLAVEKNIDLDARIQYTIRKLRRRIKQPKV
jgi:NTP pyrophosphatase (non-canonical NTP hydrolase)